MDVRVGCVSVAAVKLGMAATAVMSVVLVMSVVVTEKVVVAVCCSCGCVVVAMLDSWGIAQLGGGCGCCGCGKVGGCGDANDNG